MYLKKLLLCTALIFGSFQISQAQVLMSLIFGDKLNNENNMFGLQAEYSSNHITSFDPSKSLGTFNLGLFFTHRWENNLELNVGLLGKYRRGATGITPYAIEDSDLTAKFAEGEVKKRINFFSLPATMRFKTEKGIFAELGSQISYRLKAVDIFEVDVPEGDLRLDVDIRDQVKKIDLSLIAGVGMYVGKDQVNAVGLRYHGGITDVLTSEPGKQTYAQWVLYTNIPIGRAKAGL